MISRPRLRTILIGVNLFVLVVPVLGIATLRIYETELVRRTEAEVIAQAAFIKAESEREFSDLLQVQGFSVLPEGYGFEREINWPVNVDGLRPLDPILSHSTGPILEKEESPQPPRGAVDPLMAQVGRRLENTLIEAQRTTMSGMNIADWHGNTVASTSESHRGMSLHHRPEVQGALDGEIVRLLRRRGGVPDNLTLESLSRGTDVRVFMSIPLAHEGRIVGVVTVWRTPQSLPKTIYENRTIFTTLMILMILSALTMAALTSFYIGRPIRRLIAQTESIARGESEGNEAIAKPGTFEVQQLSESIAEMATALDERSEYIRTFARSVSHEFKTPLTSIQGTVELLQDHLTTMSTEERDTFLDNLHADARRLDQLVGRLLELARADVTRQSAELIDPLPIIERLADAHRTDNFQIHLDLPDEVQLAISDNALSSVLTNLIVNARQHGGSNLYISLQISEDDDSARLHIQDDGPGISEGNAARIFDDFFTTARDQGGTGLGLSITRALLEAHGATIHHLSSEKGAAFAVIIGPSRAPSSNMT